MGLHGGAWSYEGDDPVVFALVGVEFVPGVAVSGSATWDFRHGAVTARVTARSPAGTSGQVRIRWSTRERRATATFRGSVAGRRLVATMPAP